MTQLAGTAGCVSETGSGGECTNGVGLLEARGVVLTRNARHAYVTSSCSNAVAAFSRQ